MKLLTVRKFPRVMNSVFVACLAFAAHGAQNVFDDAVFWFRGGKDINGNGYMQSGEFFDDLHADSNDHPNHQMSITGFAQNAELRTEPVVFPALGTNVVENLQVLHIDNKRGFIDGVAKWHPITVVPHNIYFRETTYPTNIRL